MTEVGRDDGGDRPALGLIGYGAFGRLTARHLAPSFQVIAHDPAATDGEGVATLADLATAAACPVLILAVPNTRCAPPEVRSMKRSSDRRPFATCVSISGTRVCTPGMPDGEAG